MVGRVPAKQSAAQDMQMRSRLPQSGLLLSRPICDEKKILGQALGYVKEPPTSAYDANSCIRSASLLCSSKGLCVRSGYARLALSVSIADHPRHLPGSPVLPPDHDKRKGPAILLAAFPVAEGVLPYFYGPVILNGVDFKAAGYKIAS